MFSFDSWEPILFSFWLIFAALIQLQNYADPDPKHCNQSQKCLF